MTLFSLKTQPKYYDFEMCKHNYKRRETSPNFIFIFNMLPCESDQISENK